MPPLPPSSLAACIEHTLLRPEAVRADFERLCAEAAQFRFHAVCVMGSRVTLAKSLVEGSDVKVVAAVGFPLGNADSDTKRYETEVAIDHGADEIDVVINVAWLKEGARNLVLRELRDVIEAADDRPVKVIIETCLLSDTEKVEACALVRESGAKFVKTSTGFGRAGATVEDVRLLREAVGTAFGIKASGGIRDLAAACALIDAGADRLGTSHGVAIMREALAAQPQD